MKIYEVDTEYFDVPIKKGTTIVKVVLVNNIRKELDELIETAQKNVNKPFNKNNTEEREHYLYWHSSLNTLKYIKERFFAPENTTVKVSGQLEGGAKEVRSGDKRKAVTRKSGAFDTSLALPKSKRKERVIDELLKKIN